MAESSKIWPSAVYNLCTECCLKRPPSIAHHCLLHLRGRILHYVIGCRLCRHRGVHLLDGCTLVALVPPGLGWVEVATPQLPVEALGRQRVLFDLKRVVLDVVERRGDHARSVLFNPQQDGLSPVDVEELGLFSTGFLQHLRDLASHLRGTFQSRISLTKHHFPSDKWMEKLIKNMKRGIVPIHLETLNEVVQKNRFIQSSTAPVCPLSQSPFKSILHTSQDEAMNNSMS